MTRVGGRDGVGSSTLEHPEPAAVPGDDGVRLTMCTAERQPLHACESQAHNARSADVRRRRGCLDRCTTPSWCRSAMISRCSEARERTMNWSECSSETRTHTTEGYRRTSVTSIDATRTLFSVATGAPLGTVP